MVNKFIFILLFFCASAHAQFVTSGGGRVKLGGMIKHQETSTPIPPDPPDEDIFDIIWISSFEGLDLDDQFTFYEANQEWPGLRSVLAEDSAGLGGYGVYNVSIEYFPTMDGTTNTGDSSKVWMVNFADNSWCNPQNAVSRIYIPITEEDVDGEFYFSFDVTFMPDYEFEAGITDLGKLPGVESHKDKIYLDSDPLPFQLDETWSCGQAWEVLDYGAEGWEEDTLKWNWYLWYPGRDTVTMNVGETTPHYKKPLEHAIKWNLYDYVNPTITDTATINLTLRIVPNTVTGETPNADGFIESFIDGAFSEIKDNLVLRDSDTLDFEWIKWYFFHNGGYDTETCRFSKAVWTAFDNPVAFEYTSESGEPIGTKSDFDRVIPLPDVRALDGYGLPQDDGSTELDLDSIGSWNFSEAVLGLFVQADAEDYFGDNVVTSNNSGLGWYGRDTTCYIVDNDNDYAFRSTTDSGQWMIFDTPEDTIGGGFLIYLTPDNPVDSLEWYFSYNFRFKPGYNHVKGGKLPGCKSTTDHTTSAPCDGYTCGLSFTPDSSELIEEYKKAAEGIAFYYKWRGMTGDEADCDGDQVFGTIHGWGDSLGGPPDIYAKLTDAVEGKWMNVTLRIVLNSTLNSYDGIFEGYLNGLLCARKTGLRLRTSTNTVLDILKFYWFFGGGGNTEPAYAPERDEYAEFDDLWVFRYGASYTDVVRGNNGAANGTVLDLPNGSRNGDGSWTKEQR